MNEVGEIVKLTEVKLKDISKNNRGYYGIGASAANYDEKKYTYLRITDINDDGTLNKTSLMSVDDEKANEFLLKENDIVFARTGASTGRSYFYDGEINNMVFAGFLIKFSLDEEKVNPRFIKYYCISQNYKNWIASSLTGSTRPNINEKQLSEMPIILPEREYQNRVVKVLDAIIKKIELNNQINENLLEIGIELLKNQFKDSELENLSNVIKFVKGKKPDDITSYKKEKYEKYLTIACLNGQELNYADATKMIISNNDLLMVMDGASSGDVYYGGYGIVGSTLARIDCFNKQYISEYIFFAMKYYKELIQSKNTGSAIPHTDKVFVSNLKIPIISMEIQEKYKGLLAKIQQNIIENEKLIKLRDTILPKLMNGEIDLDKIEI